VDFWITFSWAVHHFEIVFELLAFNCCGYCILCGLLCEITWVLFQEISMIVYFKFSCCAWRVIIGVICHLNITPFCFSLWAVEWLFFILKIKVWLQHWFLVSSFDEIYSRTCSWNDYIVADIYFYYYYLSRESDFYIKTFNQQINLNKYFYVLWLMTICCIAFTYLLVMSSEKILQVIGPCFLDDGSYLFFQRLICSGMKVVLIGKVRSFILGASMSVKLRQSYYFANQNSYLIWGTVESLSRKRWFLILLAAPWFFTTVPFYCPLLETFYLWD